MRITRAGAALGQIVICGLWLGGGILFAAVVAPAAFAVLPNTTLAGDLVGRVLPVVLWSGMAVFAAVMVLGAWTDAASRFKPRVLAGAIGGTACMIAEFVVDTMIARVQARIHGPVDALAATNPLRVAFGQLHLLSVVLFGIAMLSALAILVIAVRRLRTAA